MKRLFTAALALLTLSACVSPPQPKDYSKFRESNPHSILILPALNQTVSTVAPDYFLSTTSQPFAERGYYTFPAHMVKSVLQDNGLSDTLLVYQADAKSMGRLFNCDSALYITIERWDSQYLVLGTTTTVEFNYELKSCKTGDSLWRNHSILKYQPQSNSTGNPLADLVSMAVTAALEKAAPNYIPLAQMANAQAANTPGQGLPAGPYLPSAYLKDYKNYPSN